MPPELRRLMERFIQIAQFLPRDPEMLDLPEDPAGRAELIIVLAEMDKIKDQIDAFLDAARRKRLAKADED